MILLLFCFITAQISNTAQWMLDTQGINPSPLWRFSGTRGYAAFNMASRKLSFANIILHLRPPRLTYPLKMDYFSREYILQPLIFRGYVKFRGCTPSIFLKSCVSKRTLLKPVSP